MKTPTLPTLFLALLAFCLPAFAGPETTPEPQAQHTEIPEPLSFTSEQELRIDGQRLRYRATVGSLIMRNEEDEPVAELAYTAYEKLGADPAKRPLMFAWNGGPGSASMWLHMGVLGPRMTDISDLEQNTLGPYRYVDNPHSILDKVDLVMVDPMGTGFSRPLGEAEAEDFHSVDADIESVSDFIKQYITETQRWASPKYILGESYGGMRAGGVSYDLLTRHNIGLNGVVLVSPYMDVAGGGGAGVANMAVGYSMQLSTYAATAWYHDMLEPLPADFKAFLAEVDEFAITDFLDVLVRGARASDAQRQAVAERLAQYTGTSADFWIAAGFRVTESQFAAELRRKTGQVVGRIDSRFIGFTTRALAERMPFDAYNSAVAPAFVASFNDYRQRELGAIVDRPYVVSSGAYRTWDRSHRDPRNGKSAAGDTGIDLGFAMIRNPEMKVLVQQGYYDLATPYRATEYFVDQLPVPRELRSNISMQYYEAGHMMYVHPPSRRKFKQDLASFIDASLN